jgi:DNA repair protein RadC
MDTKRKNVHNGHRQRLKDAALAGGLVGMSSYQVLELLLFYAVPFRDTNELAHTLIDHFGSLSAVLDADYDRLVAVPGVGPHAAALLTLMPDFFRCYNTDSVAETAQFLNGDQARRFVKGLFIGKTYEEFYLICLTGSYRLIKAELLNRGSLSEVTVYPRVAVEKALLHKAKYVILAHNHPGGVVQPSADDLAVTQKISALLGALSITVLDHFLVVGDDCFSFREKGLIGPSA